MAIKRLSELACQFGVENYAKQVLGDPRFAIWSGSSESYKHHYGKGKLAEHTLEVVELCLANNEYFVGKGVEPVRLYLAALFHDAGKMWDYEPGDESYNDWRAAYHKRHIHHVSRSGLVWHEANVKYGVLEYEDEVLHGILSHHGAKEWGSPVTPNTRLAWLLHLCDSMSARMDDVYLQRH